MAVKISFWVACYFLLIFDGVYCKRSIKIGGLFDSDEDYQERAFRNVVDLINSDRSMLPRHELIAMVERVPKYDSFAVSKAMCAMLQEGVVGIFGPTSGTTSSYVQSVCDSKELPHVEMRPDPAQGRGNCVINLYPHPYSMSKVFVDLVKAYNWKSFTVLYENGESLPKLSELIKMYNPKGYFVSYKQIDYGTGNYRPIFQQVKKSGETNFVLDVSIEKLYDVLVQAQQIGLMSDDHSYIITNPDLHTLDLDPFQYGGVNITGVRFVDPDEEDVVEVIKHWNEQLANEYRSRHESTNSQPNRWGEYGRNEPEVTEAPPDYEEMTPNRLRTETALIYDAVYVFASGLKELNSTRFHEKNFNCDEMNSWEHGFTMINYMRTNQLEGLTRGIKFDHAGYRTDFLLDIVELSGMGIRKIGMWNSTEGLNLTRHNQVYQLPVDDGSLVNRSFIVLTALSPPYGMLKEASVPLEGNDRFEGFGIELIQEIAKMQGFNYTFVLQHDGVYGSINRQTGEWNGMVRQLLDWKADLAITDLTITSERESAVDFTMPFMNLGISILYKKPTKQPPKLFSFMSPFSNEVWLFLGTAYMGVSVLLFVMGRIAPKEWQNPYPCIEEPEHLENQFSMANSLWFTVGSVLQQGSELAPIAISTRMIAGVWWFFTLIIVSSYTANLAAFLTVESLTSPINDADDLAGNPHGIAYGAKRDGSTLNFFKDAEHATYQKMYEYMASHPEALTGSNPEGVKRVQDENYAYLMESTSIEYITERNCEVTMIGGLLDDKGYGIAMRKNSPYRDALSTAVLKLQEQGKLQAMKIKWWKEKRGGGACAGVVADSSSVALTFANVGGVFLVLIVGSVMAIFVTFIDFIWNIWATSKEAKEGGGSDATAELGLPNVGGVFVVLLAGCAVASVTACGEMFFGIIRNSQKHKVPFVQELKEEFKFVAKFSGDTKPVRHRRSSSQSSRSVESGSAKSKSRSKEDLNEMVNLKVPENVNNSKKSLKNT